MPHHGAGHEDGEEYATLLDYVAKSAEKKSTGQSTKNKDGSYEKKERIWYMPWKTKTVRYDRNDEPIKGEQAKVTPEDW